MEDVEPFILKSDMAKSLGFPCLDDLQKILLEEMEDLEYGYLGKEKNCERCGKRFVVTFPVDADHQRICQYHWGRLKTTVNSGQ